MTSATWAVDRYCPGCGHPLASHDLDVCRYPTGGGRACPCDRYADTAPTMDARIAEAVAATSNEAEDRLHGLWAEFAAASDFEYVEGVHVRDPDTWNPMSPLRVLLRMAAAGDLTPLADALWSARTTRPAPTPAPRVSPETTIRNLRDIPTSHYAIVKDRFIVCVNGLDDVWSCIIDRTYDEPVAWPSPRSGDVFRCDSFALNPAAPEAWVVHIYRDVDGWGVYRPMFVDSPSQLAEAVRRESERP